MKALWERVRAAPAAIRARAAARRHLAGSTAPQALRRARRLAARGIGCTLAVLGEDAAGPSEAEAAAAAYRDLLDRLPRAGVDRDVSLKPSLIGLRRDADLCAGLLADLLARAAAVGADLWLDMEAWDLVGPGLDLYHRARAAGHRPGLVLQADLCRSAGDLRALAPLAPDLRVVRGAYAAPPGESVRDPRARDAAFLDLLAAGLAAGGRVGAATHDPALIERVLGRVAGIPPGRWELLLLHGAPRRLRESLRRRGLPLRIYLPFGVDADRYLARRRGPDPTPGGAG
ncbi:MAG: proline dehydrogenase family protein [Candidatus Krumholzibacteriota bacterium]|nr:proline dehydrogenase family protein [Candidatus Krumholzibacteriota bacterium]